MKHRHSEPSISKNQVLQWINTTLNVHSFLTKGKRNKNLVTGQRCHLLHVDEPFLPEFDPFEQNRHDAQKQHG